MLWLSNDGALSAIGVMGSLYTLGGRGVRVCDEGRDAGCPDRHQDGRGHADGQHGGQDRHNLGGPVLSGPVVGRVEGSRQADARSDGQPEAKYQRYGEQQP